MSLNLGLIALEGNHLAELLEFFGDFGYRLAGVDWLDTKASTDLLGQPHPSGNVDYKPVYYDTRWTIIIDPDLSLATNNDALSAYARDKSCRACACICGPGGRYSFCLFSADGGVARAIDICGGRVERSEGTQLKGEPETADAMDEAATLALFAQVVSPFDDFEVEREYTVYSLVHRERERLSIIPKTKKPWWKFW